MNNTIPDPAEPIGNVTIVEDFLPPVNQLVPRQKNGNCYDGIYSRKY